MQGFSGVDQIRLPVQETYRFDPWRRKQQPTPLLFFFFFPLHYSCMGNNMDRGAWQAAVNGTVKELDMTQQLNSNSIYVARGRALITLFIKFQIPCIVLTSILSSLLGKKKELLWQVMITLFGILQTKVPNPWSIDWYWSVAC